MSDRSAAFDKTTNRSRQAVHFASTSLHFAFAISALWQFNYPDGSVRRTRHQSDVFLPAGIGKVLAESNAHLYPGPSTCVADQNPPIDLSRSVTLWERDTTALLHDPLSLENTVDAVVLQAGQLFANNSAYATEITQRVSAANAVAAHLRAEISRGPTKPQALATLAAAGHSRLGAAGEWFRTFADALSRTRATANDAAFDAYLDSLARLNAPISPSAI